MGWFQISRATCGTSGTGDPFHFDNKCFCIQSRKTNINIILYVNTIPQICLNRIKRRNRTEELGIPIDYLIQCHNKHKEWLDKSNFKIVEIDGHISIPEIEEFVIQFINVLMLK